MIGITGITGTIGSFLALRLVSDGFQIHGLVRNIEDAQIQFNNNNNIHLFEGNINEINADHDFFRTCDTIIHCAGFVSFNPNDHSKIYQTNVEGTKNIVYICQELQIKKLVHISSIAAIGREKNETNIDENTKWVDGSLNSYYAKSKYLAELEVWRAIEEGLNATILNPSVILAPGNVDRSSNAVFKTIYDGLKIYPSGSVSVVDIRDVVDAILICLKSNFNAQRFIINAHTIPYIDFFSLIADKLKVAKPSIKLNKNVALFFYYLLFPFRSFFHKKLITKDTIINSSLNIYYNNKKSIDVLGVKYNSLDETINWVCSELLSKKILK